MPYLAGHAHIGDKLPERDQGAIDQWGKNHWPRNLQTLNGAEPAWASPTNQRSA